MNGACIVPVGAPEPRLLHAVAAALGGTVTIGNVDPTFARHPERHQFHSSALIERLSTIEAPLVVGITEVDLYIPILTFVFGEAQLGGRVAVVSYHRLTQEFYGLPGDEGLLRQRLIKEAIHEVGHTSGLTHCDDYECVMAASHTVEWLDLKGAAMCERCHVTIHSKCGDVMYTPPVR